MFRNMSSSGLNRPRDLLWTLHRPRSSDRAARFHLCESLSIVRRASSTEQPWAAKGNRASASCYAPVPRMSQSRTRSTSRSGSGSGPKVWNWRVKGSGNEKEKSKSDNKDFKLQRKSWNIKCVGLKTKPNLFVYLIIKIIIIKGGEKECFVLLFFPLNNGLLYFSKVKIKTWIFYFSNVIFSKYKTVGHNTAACFKPPVPALTKMHLWYLCLIRGVILLRMLILKHDITSYILQHIWI